MNFPELFLALLKVETRYTLAGHIGAATAIHRVALKLITGDLTPEWIIANIRLVEDEG